jgi:hypothetical protein
MIKARSTNGWSVANRMPKWSGIAMPAEKLQMVDSKHRSLHCVLKQVSPVSSRLLFVTLLASCLTTILTRIPAFGQGEVRPIARAESDNLELSSRKDITDAIHVANKKTGEAYSISLPDDIHHVDELYLATSSRTVALTSHNNFGRLSAMLILDLQGHTVVDELIGGGFALSPDKRYIDSMQWQPAHYDNGTSSLAYAYDLAASRSENRITRDTAGIPIYPPNVLNSRVPPKERHEFGASFFWLAGADVVGFGDTLQDELSLVIIDFRPGVRYRSTFVQPIGPPPAAPSVCKTSPVYVDKIEASSRGADYVAVDLAPIVSTNQKCGMFTIAVPGLKLPQ